MHTQYNVITLAHRNFINNCHTNELYKCCKCISHNDV